MAVHTSIKLMNDIMVTSFNCYITGIFQPFHNKFIKMHQNVNIETHLRKEEMSYHNLNYIIVT